MIHANVCEFDNKRAFHSSQSSPNKTYDVDPPPSKLAHLGFLELAAGINPDVDIVAIHGLDGHREKSWTADNGTLWLRDLLPADIPNARILSYGYDADTRSDECVSAQSIYRHAEKFMQELSRKRKEAPRRPIILVAHSLGGIILKQALVIGHIQSSEPKSRLGDILGSTHGVIFFGTPHSGTKGVGFLQILNGLLSVYMKTTDTILSHLKANSSELETIQSSYLWASKEINTVCFYEIYPTRIVGGRQEMIVPRHSATLPGDRQAVQEGLHADHCQMVKFSHKGQNDYETVMYYVNDWAKGAARVIAEKWAREDIRRDAERGDSSPSTPELNIPKTLPAVSRSYIERPDIESSMTQKLLPTGGKRHQPRCILHGIGGAGKTQLGTRWIKEHEKSFERVIMVDATSKRQLEADLRRALRTVGPEYNKATWEDAVAYLDGKERGWLLFVDNVDLPDLNLGPYLPSSAHGAILMTTRNQNCSEYAPDDAIHVGGLAESEAIDLLHNIAKITPVSNDASLEIVRELGMLALAVSQAGAYIAKTRRLGSYLDTLRKHRDRLLRENTLNSTNYPHSTYAAFDLSFRQLPRDAQKLLKIFAYFHHSSIPMALFETSIGAGFTARTVLENYPPPKSDELVIAILKEMMGLAWDELLFQAMIDAAQRASFVTTSTDDAGNVFYSLHPLLQRYIKDAIGDEEGKYACMAGQVLLGGTHCSVESNGWYWQLLPHIDALPESVKTGNIAHTLAFDKVYDSLGVWKESKRLRESALSKVQGMQGHSYEDTIVFLSWIAEATHQDGQLEEAEKLQREVLDMHVEIFGRHHPDTIIAMGNLANTVRDGGQLEEAEKLEREVLDTRIRLLGRHHPDTAMAMGNLANTLGDRGQLEEAENLERQVLDMRIKIFGRRHPDTVSAMGNLAITLRIRGQLEEAERLQREVLDMRVELLGRRHPDTVMTMGSLASILSAHGNLEEAENLARESVQLGVGALGKDHPLTKYCQQVLEAIMDTWAYSIP